MVVAVACVECVGGPCGPAVLRQVQVRHFRRQCLFAMSLRVLACVCLCRAASALLVSQRVVGDLSSAEATLARTCGVQCLALLHAKSALLQHDDVNTANASQSQELLGAVAEEAGRTLKAAVGLVAAQGSARREGSVASAPSGVACSTPAACAIKTLGANRCNYARVAMQQAYNELNVATQVLGVMVSSLCGCLHSGHVSICAMRAAPATRTFPYTVYAKAFAGSAQVWEAVKASTETCILHGDAGLLK